VTKTPAVTKAKAAKARKQFDTAMKALEAFKARSTNAKGMHALLKREKAAGRALSALGAGKDISGTTWPAFDFAYASILRMAKSLLSSMKVLNDHPGLEEYGENPLNLSMSVPEIIAEVGRRKGTAKTRRKKAPAATREAKKETLDEELRVMDLLVAATGSRNKAAKLMVGPERSISPLLKRYRAARGYG